MAKTKGSPLVDEDWRRSVSFSFDNDKFKAPAGFSDLSIDDEITVVVRGKVTRLSASSDSSGLELRMENVELVGKQEKVTSLKEALSETQSKKKK